MSRTRDYKEEYRRRKEKWLDQGYSLSQARGHPRAGERLITARSTVPPSEPRLEAALKRLRKGDSLKHASRSTGVAQERLRRFVKGRDLARREGRRWIVSDPRPRRVRTLSQGAEITITARDYSEAALAGEFWDAVGRFLATNDLDLIAPFRGRGVIDVAETFHPFETDPNAIHRLASKDAPAFHEVYRIVA